MEKINAKERTLRTIALEEADRTPFGFSANPVVLGRLQKHLGAVTHQELLTRLQADIVDLRGVVDPVYAGPVPYQQQQANGVKQNLWGMRQVHKETLTGSEEMYCDFPLQGATTLDELAAHPWPSPDWFDFSDFADRLKPWEEFAVMATGPSIWQHPSFLRGLDQLLMDLIAQPEMGGYMMDRFTDYYVGFFDRMFTAAPGQVDIMRIADDLGMQDRLLISPELFDAFFAERLKRLVDMAHSHGVKVMFHSCGAIVPLIDRLIEIGVDILDPLQVTAAGMEPRVLKERFGARVCLHGAIDTQHLLPEGAPDDVRETAHQMIKILGAGGGYIVCPSHVLQSDVPLDNILALYATERSL